MARINADLSGYDTCDDFAPVPPGEYVVKVDSTEVKVSKAGNEMVSVMFEILGPTHAGRKLFDQFVLKNEVAMKRLKSLATAAGHRNPNWISDSDELHGLECIVKVKVDDQENTGYEPKNVISSFKPLNRDGAQQPPASSPAGQAGVPAQAKKAAYPWQKTQA